MYYVKEANIPVFEFFRADYATRQEFLDAIFTQATNLAPEFYALAGFMVIVPPSFLQANEGKVINIHPSLLPAYPGLNTHTRALHDKQKTHGCTVHYVNEIVDGGAIIAQSSVVVQNDDTADTPCGSSAERRTPAVRVVFRKDCGKRSIPRRRCRPFF